MRCGGNVSLTSSFIFMATSSVIPVPSLSTRGWVSEPAAKIDLLLAHFFVADFNQTYLYPGRVISLPRLLQKNGSDIEGLMSDMKDSLFNYISRYYESVDIEVTSATDLDVDPKVAIELVITITVVENAVGVSYARLMKAVDGKLDKIIVLNNG